VTVGLKNGQQIEFSSGLNLVAVDVSQNSDSLHLEKIGIEVDKRGHILTNEKYQTKLSTILLRDWDVEWLNFHYTT